MEREHFFIGPDPSESPRSLVDYIIRIRLETEETLYIPPSCLPDLWYEIRGIGVGFADIPGEGWGPARCGLRAWPARPEFKAWTEPHVEQFGAILFDSEDVLRPTGYLALFETEKQLALAREEAYQKLRRRLVRVWEDRAGIPSFDDVREARRKLDEARRGGAETLSEFYSSGLGSKWSTYVAVSRVVEEYLRVSTRHVILDEVLKEFVRYGKQLRCETLSVAAADRTPFDVQLTAIRMALVKAGAELPQNNAELYRLAAEVGNLRYSEPSNAILKSVGRHFEPRYGQNPPSSPEEWWHFFRGHGAEVTSPALVDLKRDLEHMHHNIHLSPDECRRTIERIHAGTGGGGGLSLDR